MTRSWPKRSHFNFANVMATIAVVLALGGASIATAGDAIGSLQIRDGSIRSVDLRDREVRTLDIGPGEVRSSDVLDDSLRSSDLRDGTITLADLGRNQRVRALLPGETVTGVAAGRFTADASGEISTAAASFPLRAPVALNDVDLIFDGAAEDTNICLGNASDPRAASGRVCFYPLATTNASGLALRAVGNVGFLLDWSATAPGTSSVIGVWSYQAS